MARVLPGIVMTLRLGIVATLVLLTVHYGILTLGQGSIRCSTPEQCEVIAGELEAIIPLAIIGAVGGGVLALILAEYRGHADTTIEDNNS